MMRRTVSHLALLHVQALCLAVMCPGSAFSSTMEDAARSRIILVAGDASLPVFDNATAALAARLTAIGGAEPRITRLSASAAEISHHRAASATLDHVLDAVAALRPGPGQGCLVFVTSHGVERHGLYLSVLDQVLTPRALDRALVQGCGDAPTVVIVSSCFSGAFARPPMTRSNRIILTAARPDRTSFGCQAGRVYTVFDQCLLGALDRTATWHQVFAGTRACVVAEEQREDATPSEPQAWFGPS